MSLEHKGRFVRIMDKPTFEVLAPIIHEAFRTKHDEYQLDGFIHSGIYYNESDFNKDMADGAIWYGAYHHDIFFGCIQLMRLSDKIFRLQKLAVVPSRRSRGMGRLLMMTAEKEAFSMGAKKVQLVCLVNDEPLLAFYKGLCYKIQNEHVVQGGRLRIAFMEKHMTHLIDQVGPKLRAYHLPIGKIPSPPKGAVEIILLYHPEEIIKQSNTGHVVQRALPAHVREIIWHRLRIEADLEGLDPRFETFLLYPSKDAVDLQTLVGQRSSMQVESTRPLRLIVIDGTWQQAQKMMSVSPVLKTLKCVQLSELPKSQYILRKNQKEYGICTLEAVAEALTELGYDSSGRALLENMNNWMGSGR